MEGLTDAELREGWERLFLTENPYDPVTLKAFTKIVRWVEALRQRPGAQAASEPVASDEFIKQFGNGTPLRYSLDDYWTAPGSGPLHATWMDKPHRLIYDLVAAVRFYATPAGERPAQAEPSQPDPVAFCCGSAWNCRHLDKSCAMRGDVRGRLYERGRPSSNARDEKE